MHVRTGLRPIVLTAMASFWDGLGHAFFYNPALPESREAFDVMAHFFRQHLRLAK